jgi:serine/threonine protein kinase
MSEWLGKMLGKVRIESLLARGGMAEVYLGTHTALERTVAVKILQARDEENQVLLERFHLEARVVAKLRHPNIVQVFDFDTIDNHPYLVMEYVEGPPLSKYLTVLHQNQKRLEIPQIVRILNSIASALQYAHETGVVHRDVKPGNILLTSRSSKIEFGNPLPLDFEPILTDFGLVRFLDSSPHTTVGRIAGTPAYMSPEQARGDTTDGRTDVYSLGVILYEILAGHVPFDGETTMGILYKHLHEPPPPIPELHPSMQAVLDRALAKDVMDRFKTPVDLARAFEATVKGNTATLGALEPSMTGTASKPWKNWKRSVLASVAVLGIIVTGLLVNDLSPFGRKTPTTTSVKETQAPVIVASPPLGPTGILQFRDKNAIIDQAVLSALAMPATPAGANYEVWLVGGGNRMSLGILSLDGRGKGTLVFDHSQGLNLLSIYDQVEIKIKQTEDSNPDASDRVAYSYTLPSAGLEYIRRLLVSFPPAPKQVALIQGLRTNTQLINQIAKEMSSSHERGDSISSREKAEAILNLLAGSWSPDYKDWNKDRQITAAGDGYGFLLNGDNLGYIQAIYSHADYAVNSPGASQNMIINGEYVKICAQNLALWTPQLRDRLMVIAASQSLGETDQSIRESVLITNQMLNGRDINGNNEIEPIAGECGMTATYEFAYQMASMPLLPVNPAGTTTPVTETGTPSPTATRLILIGTPTKPGGDEGGSDATAIPPVPTKKSPPGQDKKPTKTPKR